MAVCCILPPLSSFRLRNRTSLPAGCMVGAVTTAWCLLRQIVCCVSSRLVHIYGDLVFGWGLPCRWLGCCVHSVLLLHLERCAVGWPRGVLHRNCSCGMCSSMRSFRGNVFACSASLPWLHLSCIIEHGPHNMAGR